MAADEYFAVFASSKMPQDLVIKLNAAIRAALKSKAMMDGLDKLSFEAKGENPAEFTQIVKSELGCWGLVVKAPGFSSED